MGARTYAKQQIGRDSHVQRLLDGKGVLPVLNGLLEHLDHVVRDDWRTARLALS